MSVNLNDVDLEDTADRCLNSGIEPLEKDIYNYKMAEAVYFLENGTVAKFTDDKRNGLVEENMERLDSANIPYPETVYSELGSEFGYDFVVVQRKMEETFRDLIQNPVNFVDEVFEDIIEPAAEEGFEVDTKPQNIYRDPETGKLGMLDIHDGKSTRADRTKPRNWMRYELKTGLNDLAENYENMQDALNAI
ncbi:MAG: hypothetical protein ACI9SF_000176 [Candidatus Nanohaloarchaea archaeon]